MDALSDLLRVIRLDGAFFYAVEAAEPWSVTTVEATELVPRIMRTADHLIPYHIVTQGRCFGGLIGEEPAELQAGDVLVFPHGDPHLMSSQKGKRIRDDLLRTSPAGYPFTVALGDQGPATTSFVCGFLACDRRPFNPLLNALPRQMHMKGVSNPWLSGFTQQLAEETRMGVPGVECVVTRLAEVLFIQVLRRHLDEMPPGQGGWLAAMRDPVVGRALTLIHAAVERPWSLNELAREVNTSRSGLASRFTQLVGRAPMQYLAHWRMQVASNLLLGSNTKVAAIGLQVGYESEAAFSRAFKRATGSAPGAWRELRRAPHALASSEQESLPFAAL